MKYRADIDGLRAVAVLSVVMFHLDIGGFAGGFVGVDVFFVISGYLITSLIIHKVERGSFSLSDFYFRRIRRLIPPLIATIAATAIAASFILEPFDMKGFARSAVAALVSVSNVLFYFEAGYWDTASELKPLLHTWSLGVEEQFYLFWPALLLLILRPKRRYLLTLSLVLLSLFGAWLCIGYTYVDQSAAFYLLPFRVFQFALGALVISLSNCAIPAVVLRLSFFVGLMLIASSVFSFGEGVVFPGWVILLPTLGTTLVLLAGTARHGGLARLLMENRLSLWIGRVSYSMYLVHWPLIALYRYRYGVELQFQDQLILAAATLVLTVALHYMVERRFYQRAPADPERRDLLSGAQLAAGVLAASIAIAIPMIHAWTGDGWAWRFSSLLLTPDQIEQGMKHRYTHYSRSCAIERVAEPGHCDLDGGINVLVIGNSHIADGLNFIVGGWGDTPGLNIVRFGDMNKCNDLLLESGQFVTAENGCRQRLDELFSRSFIEALDIVVYSSNKPFYRGPNQLQTIQVLERMKQENPRLKLIILGGYINTIEPCSRLINESGSFETCVLPENASYFGNDPASQEFYARLQSIADHFVDRVALLCEDRQLPSCLAEANGVPAFYDRHHQSLEFAEMAGRLYADMHPNLLSDLKHRD